MKICFKCKKLKDLGQYYKHSKMKDRHLNKCKECTKSDNGKRYNEKILDPSFIEKERCRGKEKYHRLNYIDKKDNKFYRTAKYRNLSKRLKIPKGMESHHWSYKDEFFTDVFILTKSMHRRIHYFLLLDEKHKCFRCKESHILLDTKEKHIDFLLFKGYDITKTP